MKYILLERGDGIRCPVLFPDWLEHALVARALEASDRVALKTLDAGQVKITPDLEGGCQASCSGESQSLGITYENKNINQDYRQEAEVLIGIMARL